MARDESPRERAYKVCEEIAAKRGLRALRRDVESGRMGSLTPYAKRWLQMQAAGPLIKALWSLAVGAATIGALVVSCRAT